PLAVGKANELEPRGLPLSDRARVIWHRFADYVEQEISPNGRLDAVRSLANKLAEHAARLAAVLTLVDDLDAGDVPAEAMAAGIELSEHYAAEALRLFGISHVSGELRLAGLLLAWLHNQSEPHISLPDIYQRGLNAIGDKATASRMVTILEDHGWLKRV